MACAIGRSRSGDRASARSILVAAALAGLLGSAQPWPARGQGRDAYGGQLHGSYDVAWAVAVDRAGGTYVAGYTDSRGFPVSGAAQPAYGGGAYDAFVLKLDATGRLAWGTYLGGDDEDRAYGLAVDATGHVYVTGYTHSADFPAAQPWQPALGGGKDAFVVKLGPDGRLVWGTLLGGGDRDQGRAVAIAPDGGVIVVGSTDSADFPAVAALQPRLAGGRDAFVAKLGSDGRRLEFATFLGGGGNELAYGVAVDAGGAVTVAGYTDSTNLPQVGLGARPALGGGTDAFAARLAPRGDRLVWSTLLGGRGDDRAWGVAVGAGGDAWVTGYTESPDFPLVAAAQPRPGGGRDAFVARIDGSGRLVASTFLGGGATDHAFAIAATSDGAAVAGYTRSADFPAGPARAGDDPEAGDAFVARLDASGRPRAGGAVVGGREDDRFYALALDRGGAAHAAGYSYSPDLPTVRAWRGDHGGGRDLVVGVLESRPARPAPWRFVTFVAGRGNGPGVVDAAALEGGAISEVELARQGAVLFHTPYRDVAGGPARREVREPFYRRVGGPEAQACVACHNQLVDGGGLVRLVSGGAGDGAANVLTGAPAGANGLGDAPATALGRAGIAGGAGSSAVPPPYNERNPAAIFGGGVKAKLGQEMTAALQAQASAARDRARRERRSITVDLEAKGVRFGRWTARADGSVDARGVSGVGADLVVRPFGAKGTRADLRDVVANAAANHLGVPAAAGDPTGAAAPDLPAGDAMALAYWVATRPAPRRDESRGREAALGALGERLLGTIGCTACHVPALPLEDPSLRLDDPATPGPAVTADLAAALPDAAGDRPAMVALYADLRRHAMGEALRDAAAEGPIGGDVFLTAPLWGVGSTGPWLHDGRAATLDEAIRWHGGEAEASRDRFIRLTAGDRAALVTFLRHLVIRPDGGTAAE